ncbi:MAG: hypothetical protein U1C72_02110, partial [Candidatus Pacearchaeota archaeon]|nr:hypothetical protein [Candidatus Pacearchaeota archaeon]
CPLSGMKEFVIAFFFMAIASSIPNLFVGISSVLHGIPELSFGDVVGNSVVDLTLVAALAGLIGGQISSGGRLIQTSVLFAIGVAFLPLLLILDGTLERGDGVVLILVFLLYSAWLLARRKEFTQVYNHGGQVPEPVRHFRTFFVSLGAIALSAAMLLLSAEGIVRSATFFAGALGIPISMIGILGVGLGSALPELYFAVAAARRGNSKIILGQLLGSVIVLATLVIGIVALLHPIEIQDFSPFSIGRFFLVISAFFFLLFTRTDRKITRKEAGFLLFLYLAFVVTEIASKAIMGGAFR